MYQQVKRLGNWAGNHKWQAQTMIVSCYVLLFALHYSYGQFLQQEHVRIPLVLVYASLGSIVVVYAIHELLHRHWFIKNWFVFHKLCCMLVLSLSFIGLLAAFTQPLGTFPLYRNKLYAAFPAAHKPVKAVSFSELSDNTNRTSRFPVGVQILLITLVVLMSAILEYILVVMSCTIACNGYGFWAIVFLVAGNLGMLTLAFFLIRSIVGRAKNHKVRYN